MYESYIMLVGYKVIVSPKKHAFLSQIFLKYNHVLRYFIYSFTLNLIFESSQRSNLFPVKFTTTMSFGKFNN
jgi:ABC-type uncharacterized transport system permease subunit